MVTAGAPLVVVGAAALLPTGAPTGDIVVGAAESGAVPLGRVVSLEAGAVVGSDLALAFAADVWGGIRLRPASGAAPAPLSLLAAGGIQVRDRVAPEVVVGLGLALPSPGAVAPHADLAWVGVLDGGPPAPALLLSVGAAFGRPPPPPSLPPVVVAPPSEPTVALTVDPAAPDARVWLPHPVCDWVPVPEVGARLAGQAPPIPATVYAPGFEPADVSLGPSTAVSLTRAAPQGAVVVVAWAGDRVTVGGAAIRPGADGTAVVTVPEGPVAVQVVGGGRAMQTRVQVESGFATWVRAEPPEPWVVRFAVGSAEPTPASRRELAARLPELGDTTLGVRGSYSPEGSVDANLRLADARALATRDLLVSLGVPADRVELLPSLPPAEGAEPGDQRVAAVVPLWPGGGP